ncbi:MAG: tRNA lysidine(34) synthetase TilS [Gammaproteobacteria bacterium]
MHFDEARLADVLARDVPGPEQAQYCVAFSGGCDSAVLLRAMATLVSTWPAAHLRAVHVDHGLDDDSPGWAAHCADFARQCAVDFEDYRVEVTAIHDQGVEAAARGARYKLLRERLRPGEVLLTAHHADDQLETFLLQLMRGAGIAGLSAMPAIRAFGAGLHVRPLLEFERRQLVDYGRTQALTWLDDPSNLNLRFDRNLLRHEVVPQLRSRWPAAAAAVTRSAAHCAEALELCDQFAAADVGHVGDSDSLECTVLSRLSPARLRNALRWWIRRNGRPAPSSARLGSIVGDILGASPDATPVVTWGGTEIRRYRDRIYIMTPLGQLAAAPMLWTVPEELSLGAGRGNLGAEPSQGQGLAVARLEKSRVTVVSRTGGERLTPKGHRQSKQLKKLFQEQGVLPWMRERVPLVYVNGELAAVADICVAQEFSARRGEPGFRIIWRDHPRLK